jgi:excisionase family DNA binding protein
MSSQLVRVDVIAELTGFKAFTVYKMAREGRIPAVKVGRSTRFDLAAVEKWMAKLPKASS